MKYKIGDKVTLTNGNIMTIDQIDDISKWYRMREDPWNHYTDEMIEGLVEEECPQDFIEKYCKSCGTQRCDRTKEFLDGCPHYNAYMCEKQNNEMKSEDELLDEYEEFTDRAFKGGYEKCKSDIELNGFQLPDGYIFKDQAGNEIHALKIVLEKANTLKTQSDNMETETHRGYYTTEEETTNKSKKVAWFTFGDNDFADKVELDLSNRELIQEDGKWFVVKKKKEYPKTYEECINELHIHEVVAVCGWEKEIKALQTLLICRDAYWKIAGEEMGLGKPWEPDWMNNLQHKHYISTEWGEIRINFNSTKNKVLAFPTEEMRDAFYENFKELIESCKELL